MTGMDTGRNDTRRRRLEKIQVTKICISVSPVKREVSGRSTYNYDIFKSLTLRSSLRNTWLWKVEIRDTHSGNSTEVTI